VDKAKLSFDAELLSVYKLFKNDAYLIPGYQRDYAWDTEQWTQLWDDLSGYQEANSEDHFLGPLIVTPDESKSDLYEVIDGQQRLTTLQMIICLIRDRWIDLGDQSTNQMGDVVPNKQLTSELIYSLTPSVRYNFTPNRYLKDVFLDFIQRNPGDGDRKQIENRQALKVYNYADRSTEALRGYRFFKGKIFAFDEETLRKFENFLLHHVYLLNVRAGGSSNAFLLFETLNYRGLELTQTDLVKSFLFSKIKDPDKAESLIKNWDVVADNLGSKSPDLFLRHYLLLFSEKVKKRDIYGEIKERYPDENSAIKLIKDLLHFSKLYSYIARENDFEGINKDVLNSLFNDLSDLGVETQSIYLLAILHRFFSQAEKIDIKRIERAARLVEVLSFRWTTCGKNAQDLETIYQVAASKIMSLGDAEELFEEAQKIVSDALPTNSEFEITLQNAVIRSATRARYILKKIDDYETADGAYVLMNSNRLHVEHVAPQRPSGDYDWKAQMKGDANYTEVIYRIGNLVLLPGRINREASNKSFDKKKPVYKKITGHAKLPILTQEVLDEDTWNQSVVKRRSEAIAKEAVKVWSTGAAALLGKVIPKVEKKTAKRTVKKTAKRTVKKTAKRTVKKTAKRTVKKTAKRRS
jgi:uncharacterized protein with ParB-like and HNH nuclease domain